MSNRYFAWRVSPPSIRAPFSARFRTCRPSTPRETSATAQVASLDIEISRARNRYPNRYRVSIHIGLPGHELLVTNAPPQDPAIETAYTVADKAFDEDERQLERWVHSRRDRRHEVSPVD
jgi:ribosome-associated translation inhibitor RaiA